MKYYFIDEFLKKIKVDDMELISDMIKKGFLVADNETEAGSPLYSTRLVKSFPVLYDAYILNSLEEDDAVEEEKLIKKKTKKVKKELVEVAEDVSEEDISETENIEEDLIEDTEVEEEIVIEEKKELKKITEVDAKEDSSEKESKEPETKKSLKKIAAQKAQKALEKVSKKDNKKEKESKSIKSTLGSVLKKEKEPVKTEEELKEEKRKEEEYKKNIEKSLAILEGRVPAEDDTEKEENKSDSFEDKNKRIENNIVERFKEESEDISSRLSKIKAANKEVIMEESDFSEIRKEKEEKIAKMKERMRNNMMVEQSKVEKATRHSKKYG